MALPVFPSLPGLEFPVKRTPEWSTVKQDALSGKRVRTQNFSYPVWHWEASFSVLRTAAAYQEFQTLVDFINSRMGATGVFLYDDPNDDTATNQLFGTADGSSTTYQLVRTLPGGSFSEPVFFPNVITDIKINGSPTSSYTLGNYGQIIFNTPPNAGSILTWDGTFYWGCRFDDDQFLFSNIFSGVYEMKKLAWSSEKLP